MNEGRTFFDLPQAQTVPAGSRYAVEMGDGTGTKSVTHEDVVRAVGADLPLGDINDLETDAKSDYVSAINEVKRKTDVCSGGANGGSVDIPITLTFTGWTGTTAPYQQTVTVPQMREGMTPLYFLASDGDAAQYAFSLITGYSAGYAEITFYAADKPTIDLPLTLKGIPAQEMEYVDNTVVFLVEPSAFIQNEETQRYEATIPVEGMTEGTGGTWDIVRSSPGLTMAESKIALSITDVDRMEGAVKITCLEVPAQRYMMSIAGAYPDAEPGTVILAGMQEWFERVETLENKFDFTYKILEGTKCMIRYNSIEAFLQIAANELNIVGGNVNTNVVCKLPENVRISRFHKTIAVMSQSWTPVDIGVLDIWDEFGSDIIIRCPNSYTKAVVADYIAVPIGFLEIQ